MSIGNATSDFHSPPTGPGQPAWDLVQLYPMQGDWRESEYLALTRSTNRFVELNRGILEVLPMPTYSHQRILRFLLRQFEGFVFPRNLGEMMSAVLRVKLNESIFREPDILFMHADHRDRMGEEYWLGADLVVEIVSPDPDSRKRDLIEKPVDYAEGGVPEYWIVDPKLKTITVLVLSGSTYETHGTFAEGTQATSKLLDGFSVNVTDVFAAGKP